MNKSIQVYNEVTGEEIDSPFLTIEEYDTIIFNSFCQMDDDVFIDHFDKFFDL